MASLETFPCGLGSQREEFPRPISSSSVVVVGDAFALNKATCELMEILDLLVVLGLFACEYARTE